MACCGTPARLQASGFKHKDPTTGEWQNVRPSENTSVFEGSLIRFLSKSGWNTTDIDEIVAKPPTAKGCKGGGGGGGAKGGGSAKGGGKRRGGGSNPYCRGGWQGR